MCDAIPNVKHAPSLCVARVCHRQAAETLIQLLQRIRQRHRPNLPASIISARSGSTRRRQQHDPVIYVVVYIKSFLVSESFVVTDISACDMQSNCVRW